MISLNAVNNTSVVGNTNHVKQSVNTKETAVTDKSSTYVSIQGTNLDTKSTLGVVVDKDNAKDMASQIAAMLSGNNMGVQANLNGFDASRLLAD